MRLKEINTRTTRASDENASARDVVIVGEYEESAKMTSEDGVKASVARLSALGVELDAVYGAASNDGDHDETYDDGDGVTLAKIENANGRKVNAVGDVEAVQLIRCKFQIKRTINFGEELRLVGSHKTMGAWDITQAMTLNWGEGDVWTTADVELPVDGVYIYKFAVVPSGQPGKVLEWQQGNNQVLTLSPDDHPRLWVYDNWSGNPNQASIYRENGESESKELRLIKRVKNADNAVRQAEVQVKQLKGDLQEVSMQVAALREEARLGANVRIALKEQLRAEQRRSNLLSSQIDAWKSKFLAITDGGASQDASGGESSAGKPNGNKTGSAKNDSR